MILEMDKPNSHTGMGHVVLPSRRWPIIETITAHSVPYKPTVTNHHVIWAHDGPSCRGNFIGPTLNLSSKSDSSDVRSVMAFMKASCGV